MHIDERLTDNVEIGALRIDPQDNLEIIRKDSGRTVRNSRIDAEPIRWEIAFPITNVDDGDATVLDANFESVRRMWQQTERGLHTFNFRCFVDGEVHKVRFDSPLETEAAASHLRKIGSVTLVEDD
jgi:hypothetical protein